MMPSTSLASRTCASSMACRVPQLGATRARQIQAGFSQISPLRAPQRSQRTRASASAPVKEATEAASAPVSFKNVQRFLVPKEAEAPFQEAWQERAAYMEMMEGFVAFNVTQSGENFSVESIWASIPAWEKFNLSAEARRQHLPSGIWQYVPKAGEGFPEDFVPFFDMNTFVMAKYPKKK